MNYLIDEQSELQKLASLFDSLGRNSGVVAVDTEFLREKTYNARLCLIQLGVARDQYCIDVLAIDDLTLLVELFRNEAILKIFHAARQDIEVIYQTLGVLPNPIFDTQLAAAFNGADMQIGYGALVTEYTGIVLAKTQSRTDWTRRPLNQEQIDYAGDDVAYLEPIYLATLDALKSASKFDWYCQEIETYYDIDKYVIKPESAYKRLNGSGLKIKQQYTLRALAEWRESTAQQRDIPRTWVLRDQNLFDLAIKRPMTEQEIVDMQVFGRKSARYLIPKALLVIRSVKLGDDKLWKKLEPLNKQQKGVCSKLMKKVSEIAEQHQVAQGLLATRKDVESLYRHRQSKRLLRGWREKIVGKKLIEYLRMLEV